MLDMWFIYNSFIPGEKGFFMLEEHSRKIPDTADNLLIIFMHLAITLQWNNTAQGEMWEDESPATQ